MCGGGGGGGVSSDITGICYARPEAYLGRRNVLV